MNQRRHTVIELPLTLSGHPLEEMVENLAIVPEVEDGRRQKHLGA
ncbi:MAG: hypothetical protein R2932_57915 [Caldilineaceae bacterium]